MSREIISVFVVYIHTDAGLRWVHGSGPRALETASNIARAKLYTDRADAVATADRVGGRVARVSVVDA